MTSPLAGRDPSPTPAPSRFDALDAFFDILDAPGAANGPVCKASKNLQNLSRNRLQATRPPLAHATSRVGLSSCHSVSLSSLAWAGNSPSFSSFLWHAGPHDRTTALCHAPLGAKLVAMPLIFGNLQAMTDDHALSWAAWVHFCVTFAPFFWTAGEHDRMTE